VDRIKQAKLRDYKAFLGSDEESSEVEDPFVKNEIE